ncbi:hypothetical protein MAR_037828 [Mya arenaria]|uniref:Uncharacterized protein n=1 Tax=Mya arenaria TaxID=6604 RepID=A0ABY7FSP8_MYAAR|nr:hypothetical protein MAR_037828 [Mya arenaria]
MHAKCTIRHSAKLYVIYRSFLLDLDLLAFVQLRTTFVTHDLGQGILATLPFEIILELYQVLSEIDLEVDDLDPVLVLDLEVQLGLQPCTQLFLHRFPSPRVDLRPCSRGTCWLGLATGLKLLLLRLFLLWKQMAGLISASKVGAVSCLFGRWFHWILVEGKIDSFSNAVLQYVIMSGHGHSHGSCEGDHDHVTEADRAAAFSLYLKINTDRQG